MKKMICYLLVLVLFSGCYSYQNVLISTIDNTKTSYQSYLVYLKNGKKVKAKYIFNRGENLEIYEQGQSKLLPLNEIEKVEGKNDDFKKSYLLMGGGILVVYGIMAILKNNGVDVKSGQNEK